VASVAGAARAHQSLWQVSLQRLRGIPPQRPLPAETAQFRIGLALFFVRLLPIVDAAGNLAYFVEMDNTQTGSVNVAVEKARSARLFKCPTKDFQDTLEAGGDGLRRAAFRLS